MLCMSLSDMVYIAWTGWVFLLLQQSGWMCIYI